MTVKNVLKFSMSDHWINYSIIPDEFTSQVLLLNRGIDLKSLHSLGHKVLFKDEV